MHTRALLLYFAATSLTLQGCGSGGDGPTAVHPQCPTNPVYVHPAGSDGNNGSASAPFATIAKALSCAYRQEIRVAGGTYTVESALAQAPDVALLGGYASDFSVRDPALYPTTISTTSTDMRPLITAEFGELNLGRIDGFTFQDKRAGKFTLIRAQVVVSNNILECTGVCIDTVDASGGAIHDNILSGGDTGILAGPMSVERNQISLSNTNAIGIDVDAPWGSALVARNVIELTAGGKGIYMGRRVTADANTIKVADGIGIFVKTGDSVVRYIRNNVILLSGSGSSTGINDSVSGSQIVNNTVLGAAGGSYEGILIAGSGGSYINNLVSLSGGICIAEYASSSDPQQFANNDLTGCVTLYKDEISTSYTAIATVNAMTDTSATGNISVDAVLDPVDASLTLETPQAVAGGGLDMSTLFGSDRTGAARTSPWSIGAYELDVSP